MSIFTVNTTPSEVRVTDPTTGGQKGQKLERFDLVPAAAMEEVARVYGRGAEKYEARNWERGYNWGLSLAALERHLAKFKQGESRDELDNHHLACVVFHALALITFERFNLGTDDRTEIGGVENSASASAGSQIYSTDPGDHAKGVAGASGVAYNPQRSQRLGDYPPPDNYSLAWDGLGNPFWRRHE